MSAITEAFSTQLPCTRALHHDTRAWPKWHSSILAPLWNISALQPTHYSQDMCQLLEHHFLAVTILWVFRLFIFLFGSSFWWAFHKIVLSCFSLVWFCATLWTAAHQAPLSMGFSRQDYWSGLPFPPQGIFLMQGSNQCLLHRPALSDWFFTTGPTWEYDPIILWNS